ncbi:MAG: 6-phosphogluconolactonase [Rhodocyclaceae bacterium]|nr:6-phosphogluconolactonase [Rhodocyclaceae bacterium]MCA3074147.1 6-phosphogluconolactonase [Rhodocyclaceae bacterium]MCA3092220.1 6-phosphogluconolactonase [Rhodocyclaceae bacterium]MCA3092376.1 6-phosphogluconolactonase [Rhodocyclaceae bacterium]MCA3097208.1 6-phosphogluconolactonase [Rhodocyclaceae bacterium]
MGLLVRLPERAALDRACATWLAYRLRSDAGPVLFAACGGRSVDGILAALSTRADVPWERVHLFLVDERVVPAGDAQSNLRQLRQVFVAPLVSDGRMRASNVHAFHFPDCPSIEAQAAAVDACNSELQALGGRFDAVLLSAGEDGHVAALFPGHRSIEDRSDGYFRFDDSPKPPASRVTASRSLLLRSRAAALVFTGESKRDALAGFVACGTALAGTPAAACGLDMRCIPACLVRALPEWVAFTDLDER